MNKRGNTSLLERIDHPNGRKRNVLIDCDREIFDTISYIFPYTVDTTKATSGSNPPALEPRTIEYPYKAFDCQGIVFQPLCVGHGRYSNRGSLYFTGFRFGNITYVSYCSKILYKTAVLMTGCKPLIHAAFQWDPYLSYFGYWQTLHEVKCLWPKGMLLIGFGTKWDT
ncbi:hypothetical protein BX070DRAFT_263187 [Coemansia spiralis]|nr:hypothetical protein BX070DRAFT_263187 [Coemansia spiralis]